MMMYAANIPQSTTNFIRNIPQSVTLATNH